MDMSKLGMGQGMGLQTAAGPNMDSSNQGMGMGFQPQQGRMTGMGQTPPGGGGGFDRSSMLNALRSGGNQFLSNYGQQMQNGGETMGNPSRMPPVPAGWGSPTMPQPSLGNAPGSTPWIHPMQGQGGAKIGRAHV